MTEAMRALDEIEAALNWMLRQAGYNGRKEPYNQFHESLRQASTALSLLPTIRAALAPAADDEVEVGAIKQRHEYAEQKGGDLYTPEYCEWSFSQCHHDRATLLRHVARLTAELEAERGRRVEVERIKAAIDEALTMACDERDEAYSQFDKLKEATGPFTWYLSSSVFDDRPDDDVPQTTEDAGRRVPRLGDYRRLRAATLTKETP